jgi:hypothetical protein
MNIMFGNDGKSAVNLKFHKQCDASWNVDVIAASALNRHVGDLPQYCKLKWNCLLRSLHLPLQLSSEITM